VLRLLVLGDSAAAGVGASDQGQALSGQLAAALAPRYRVEWQLAAKTGATTMSTLGQLALLGAVQFDVAVTSLGVNDVVSAVGLATWRREQRQLRAVLRESFGVRQLIVSGLPPMSVFPALPQPLRWYLGRRARQFDSVLAEDLVEEDDVAFLPLDFACDVQLMATDGYHPGPAGYRAWAQRVAALVP
jgi:lysophospholipase L1-like esterase